MMMIVIGKVAIVVFVVWGVYLLACHVRDKNMTKKEKKIADEKIYLEVKEKLDKDASDANKTFAGEDESQLMTWTKEDGEKSMQNEDFGNTKFIEHSTPKKKKSEEKIADEKIYLEVKEKLDKDASDANDTWSDETTETDEHGTKRWYKKLRLHRLDGPAIEWDDGAKWYYKNGIRYYPEDEGLRDTTPNSGDVVEAPKKKKRKHKTRYLPATRKRYRKSYGWSQVDVARWIICAPSTVSDLENNDVDSKTAEGYDNLIYDERQK